MYIQVKLLNGFREPLLYELPEEIDKTNLEGSIISVPVKNKTSLAVISKILDKLPDNINFKIKKAYKIEQFVQDTNYLNFISNSAKYYGLDSTYFYTRLKSFLDAKEESEYIQKEQEEILSEVNLTTEQLDIVNKLSPEIINSKFSPSLIHGVTGSGKTEIYKKLIIHAINNNKTCLLLLPEVSLSVQFTNILKKQLSNSIKIFGFHSATSVTEKRELWQYLLNKQACLIIGVHLPVFLPINNLGLIIIDEEHDIGFQEKRYPKINTKEIAILRAQTYNVPIIMGSATPSISSLNNIKKRNWQFFELKKRFSGAFPTIKFVKLINNTENNSSNNNFKKSKNTNFWISEQLQEAISDRLNKKEQIIIFINRRGYSFFIQCKNCGHIENCQSCSVSLTLHIDQKLKCHYCDFNKNIITACPTCKAGESYLLKKGIGTQQVVTILEKLFPNAKIARADLDNTINKKKWSEIITNFENRNIDILVGTQTITKGYHFPGVTLVGILWADINLSFPVYNAAEITLQQLIQVAGRAGRQSLESLVIVQSMITHPIFNYLNETDYYNFYLHEISNRAQIEYPPFIRLAQIELKNKDNNIIDTESQNLAKFLIKLVAENKLNIKILGPSEPPVSKIQNIYSRNIYLKSDNISQVIQLYQNINFKLFSSSIFFTPNPLR